MPLTKEEYNDVVKLMSTKTWQEDLKKIIYKTGSTINEKHWDLIHLIQDLRKKDMEELINIIVNIDISHKIFQGYGLEVFIRLIQDYYKE